MKSRGFTLIEVLSVVLLLGVFTLISSQVFIACLRVPVDTARTGAAVTRFDAAVHLLGRDVWGGSALRVVDPHTVVIDRSNAPAITWRLEDGGTLVRSMPDGLPLSVRRWPGMPASLSFKVEAAVLVLNISGPGVDGPSQPIRIPRALAFSGGQP